MLSVFDSQKHAGRFVDTLSKVCRACVPLKYIRHEQPLHCHQSPSLSTTHALYVVVDVEDTFAPSELDYIWTEHAAGMALLVIADWYNASVMAAIGFHDDNTK
jgi:hypothetical protein